MSETTVARRFTRGPYPEQRLNACELYCFLMTFTIGYLMLLLNCLIFTGRHLWKNPSRTLPKIFMIRAEGDCKYTKCSTLSLNCTYFSIRNYMPP